MRFAWLAVLLLLTAVPARADVPVLHEPLPPLGPGDGAVTPDAAETPASGAVDLVHTAAPDALPRTAVPTALDAEEDPRLSPPGDVGLDARTGRDERLTYYAVFDPSIVPFKRGYVRDAVRDDGRLTVADAALRPVVPRGHAARPGHDLFWGSFLVDFGAGRPVPIPSVAPGGAVLEYEVSPPLAVEFEIDGADNLFVVSESRGRVRLNVLVDAPHDYFAGAIPDTLRIGELDANAVPPLPARFRAAALEVFAAIRAAQGLPPGPLEGLPVRTLLAALALHFRAFSAAELEVAPEDPVDRYRAIALSQRGVCRHRAYAFVVTALALGMRARYVANEAHAFVEVNLGPHEGWRRIDLGGAAAGFEVRGAANRTRHVTGAADPLPAPPSYEDTYSARFAAEDLAPLVAPRDDAPLLASEEEAGPTVPGDGRAATHTTLHAAQLEVFRGETVALAGAVTDTRGGGRPGLEVDISLAGPRGSSGSRRLATVRTDDQGRFGLTVRVPESAAPGRYHLRARCRGDANWAPSASAEAP